MSKEDNVEAQPSWWARQQKSFQAEVSNFNLEDCDSCRYIGGGGMIGAGLYIAYVGYSRAKRVGKRWGFIPSTVAASVLWTLGAMRLASYNPFTSSNRSVGIDALDPIKERIAKSQAAAELWRKQQKEMAQKEREKSEQMQEKQQGVEQIGQQEGEGPTRQGKDLTTSKDKVPLS